MRQFSGLLLLALIYLAFISLGLPDSVLGVAWPAMRLQFGLPLEAAGAITSTLTICSALSGFVLARLGTGLVVGLSGVLTGGALLGIAFAPGLFPWIILLALPLGFGAGSVDAGLNHYVAAHYSSRHMSWLHASWGIGATIGPAVMSRALAGPGWSAGYRILGSAQLVLAAILLASLPLWRAEEARRRGAVGEARASEARASEASVAPGSRECAGAQAAGATPAAHAARAAHAAHAARGRAAPAWAAPAAPLLYFVYAAVEVGTGLWAATILVEGRGLDAAKAGLVVAAYYGSIMGGRVLSGFIADRVGNRPMVRGGIILALSGAILFAIPGLPLLFAVLGLALLGLGCAPIYPCLMHETPRRFAPELARKVVGRQVAFAYVGGAILPAAFGFLGSWAGAVAIMPAVALALLCMLALSETLNVVT